MIAAVLLRLAFGAAAILALAAFALGLLGGASLSEALWRATVVLTVATVVIAVCFRRLARVLYDYMAQRMAEESRQGGKASANGATRAPEGRGVEP